MNMRLSDFNNDDFDRGRTGWVEIGWRVVEGLFFNSWLPGSGWLRPISVCRSLAATEGVHCIEHCGDIQLQRAGGQWQALAEGRPIAGATCAVVATGCSTGAQPGLEWLRLRS